MNLWNLVWIIPLSAVVVLGVFGAVAMVLAKVWMDHEG